MVTPEGCRTLLRCLSHALQLMSEAQRRYREIVMNHALASIRRVMHLAVHVDGHVRKWANALDKLTQHASCIVAAPIKGNTAVACTTCNGQNTGAWNAQRRQSEPRKRSRRKRQARSGRGGR